MSVGLVAVLAVSSAAAAPPIVGTNSAPVKKPLSVQQKNQMARALRESPAARKAPPKTVAQARATRKLADGADAVEVPEELHHYLGAKPDDKGRMRISDIDPAAPNQTKVEVADEQ